MNNPIEFVLEGQPVAQPRQRFRVTQDVQGRNIPMAYQDPTHPVHHYKSLLEVACREHWRGGPVEGAIAMSMLFVFQRPARTPRSMPDERYAKITKPDVDNCCKAVMDALTGLVFKDDKQVATIFASKAYAARGEGPRTVVTITRL